MFEHSRAGCTQVRVFTGQQASGEDPPGSGSGSATDRVHGCRQLVSPTKFWHPPNGGNNSPELLELV